MRTVRSIVAGLFVMLIASTAWAAACDGFTDVDSSDTSYCSAVTYLKDKGITLGCTGTAYCPNDYVTRLQMALFMQRLGRGAPTNTLGNYTDTIGGGTQNAAESFDGYNVVAGGLKNYAAGGYSATGGGENNEATGFFSTVSGGGGNIASGFGGTVNGGENNFAAGNFSSIPGGNGNTASGYASFAAGTSAYANLTGCFVWGDASTTNPVTCGAFTPNEFVVRSVGGVYFLTAGTNNSNYTGAALSPGASSWTTYSDRNGKDNVEVVDPRAVLERLVAMPVATWNWKSQDPSIRHMGPMAQDFAAAFHLGETPRGINTVDADGVALAAIQGLHQMLVARDSVIAEQAHELAEIKAQLAAMAAAH